MAKWGAIGCAGILVLESEFDTLRSWQARQPDSRHFRLWEVAGTAFGAGPVARAAIPGYQGDVGGQLVQIHSKYQPRSTLDPNHAFAHNNLGRRKAPLVLSRR